MSVEADSFYYVDARSSGTTDRAREMVGGFFRRWREARAEAAAKHAEFERLFDDFLRETAPLVPKNSSHPKAALYRHAWKRACVLGIIYQQRSDELLAGRFREFETHAAKRYFEAAPKGLYGKAPLQFGEKTGARLLEFEKRRLFPSDEKRPRPLACIYIGECENERVYVGQTVGAPESRWVQHRFGGTGPFKTGALYVRWKVVEGESDLSKLDERESYYIGLYDANKNGYNDTMGNDWQAYERGCAERYKNNTVLNHPVGNTELHIS
jgi:hypothetical protein